MVSKNKEKIVIGIAFVILLFLIFVVFLVRADYAPTIVQSGTVTGVITYGPSNPLGKDCATPSANIGVDFVASSGKSYVADTNKSGSYTISLPVGTYTMKFPEQSNGTQGQYIFKKQQSVNVITNKRVVANGCWNTGIESAL